MSMLQGRLRRMAASAGRRLALALLAGFLACACSPTFVWADDTSAPEDVNECVSADDQQNSSVSDDGAPVENEQSGQPSAGDLPGTAETETPADADNSDDAIENASGVQDESDSTVEEGDGQSVESLASQSSNSDNGGVVAEQLTVYVKVVGPDTVGNDVPWVSLSEVVVDSGTTAAAATLQVLARNGMSADPGIYAISSRDGLLPNGRTRLSFRHDWKRGWLWWQLFINGATSDVPANKYKVHEGDTLVWYYAGKSASEPEPDPSIEVTPDAERPDYTAYWGAYKGTDYSGTVENDLTPTDASTLEWSTTFNYWVNDPIIVNGDVYLASRNTLMIVDAQTGAVKKSAQLAERVNSTCRMVYADGLIIVPLGKGRLQALTADTLATVWVTDALPSLYQTTGSPIQQQSLSSLFVRDGAVYYATSAPSGNDSLGGWLVCVNTSQGALKWAHRNDDAGYYWSGMCPCSYGLAISDDAGNVSILDPATGEPVVPGCTLDAPVRSGVVSAGDGETLFVASQDGVLHKLVVSDEGLTEVASVAFGSSSTSTPTLSNGILYVGGCAPGAGNYNGVLALIDAETMTIVQQITHLDEHTALPADVKSAPLVATHENGTYVYFTCNSYPGGVYAYRVGSPYALMLYTPEAALQQYSMSSVICNEMGSLFYSNDSKTLFALKSFAGFTDPVIDPVVDPENPDSPTEPPLQPAAEDDIAAAMQASSGGTLSAQGASAQSANTSQTNASQQANTANESEKNQGSSQGDDGDSSARVEAQYRDPEIPPVEPIVGVVVGACGLGAAVWWVLIGRRGI